MFLSAIETEKPNFVLLDQPVANDENVQKIYQMPELLPPAGRHRYEEQAIQTDEIGELLVAINKLTAQLTKLHSEQAEAYNALQDRHDDALKQIADLQSRLDAYDRSILDRVSERTAAMGNGFINLKAGIRDHAADFVLDFRMNGACAKTHVLELFDIEGKLQWMRGCITNGIYELNKSMDKQARMAQAYRDICDATDTAMQQAGKDTSLLSRIAELNRNFFAKKEEIFGKILQAYESLGAHLDDMTRHVSDYVRLCFSYRDALVAEKLQREEQKAARREIADAFDEMQYE